MDQDQSTAQKLMWRVQNVAKDHALIWEGDVWVATTRSQEWAKQLVEEHNAKVPSEPK